MVMIALDHVVLSDINGKFGGGHFRYDTCGLHFQQNPRRTTPPSEYELEQRKFFLVALHYWRRESFEGTYSDRYSWTYYARLHPVKNKKGETKILSPFHAFLSVNIQRLIEGQPVFFRAPGITDPPPPPRLTLPIVEVGGILPWGCYTRIVFPQPMETSLTKTPPLTDFTLVSLLLDLFSSDIGRYKPTDKAWLNPWTLELRYDIFTYPGVWRFEYRRGSRPFETLALPERHYGSFNYPWRQRK